MSVTFQIYASPGTPTLNVTNTNARALLEILGFELGPALVGEVPASELAARARRLLWPERKGALAAQQALASRSAADQTTATFIICERSDDYFVDRLSRLLELADRAILLNGVEAAIVYS